MNNETPITMEQQMLLAAFGEWSNSPVTKKLVDVVGKKCNQLAGQVCGVAVTPSHSDATVRSLAIQLAAYSELHRLITSANTFIETIPTVPTQPK